MTGWRPLRLSRHVLLSARLTARVQESRERVRIGWGGRSAQVRVAVSHLPGRVVRSGRMVKSRQTGMSDLDVLGAPLAAQTIRTATRRRS
jgi:hypothetical protein